MVIINGVQSESGEILLDTGYLFGRGVFETILVKSEPIFLKQHCERLEHGLEVLGISNPVTACDIAEQVKQHGIHDCVLKVVVTERNIVLTTRPVSYELEDYQRGFKLTVSSLRRNPFSHVTYLKSLNYTDNLLEKERAKASGFDEVVFRNTQGDVAEASMSNLFFARDGRLFTPAMACGILAGTVRAWVLDNFTVAEGAYPLDALMEADEVFLTNSVMGAMRVSSIDGTPYGAGPVCRAVQAGYEETMN